MFDEIENLKLTDVIQGISVHHRAFPARPSHALIFKISGESRYTFRDREISLTKGEMLFIPKGAVYTVDLVSQGCSRFVLINFQADLSSGYPRKYRFDDQGMFSYMCTRLCKHRVLDTAADKYKCISLFYELLAYIAESGKTAPQMIGKISKIAPAVEYMKENLFDPTLKIGQLHLLCGVSDTYFRKVFISHFGSSPKQYVLNRRLTHAKALIKNGEFNSISEVALLSGFDDALYFSRVYKAKYGFPPSENHINA